MAPTKERALELKVGLLILAALVVVGGFVFILGNFSVGKGYSLYVDFNFSGNIQPGASVKVSGIKVGRVEEVIFFGGKVDAKTGRRVQVRLRVWVEERVKDTIREDAEFFVSTSNVLGEQYLEIAPGSYERAVLPPGAIVVGVDPPRTDSIIARLYDFLDAVTILLKEDKEMIRDLIRGGSGAVRELSALLSENRAEIKTIIASTAQLADEGTAFLRDVRSGLGDPRVFGRAIADLDLALISTRRALDELVPRGTRFLDDASRALSVVTAERFDHALGAVDRVVVVLESANRLVEKLDGLVGDIRAGKGTAGALLVKDEIYVDLKEMIRDLKRNPWKFLWKE